MSLPAVVVRASSTTLSIATDAVIEFLARFRDASVAKNGFNAIEVLTQRQRPSFWHRKTLTGVIRLLEVPSGQLPFNTAFLADATAAA